MKKTIKLVMLFACVAVLMLSTAACTNEVADAPEEDASNGKTETTTDGTEEPVVIKMIATTDWENMEAAKLLEAMEKFPEKAPNVVIDFEYVPFAELDQKVLLANAGGNTYDLILVNNTSVASFAQAGVLANLDEFIAEDNFDYDNYFFPALGAVAKYEDAVHAMPINTDTRVLAVNTKMFEEYNLEYPETKEDMIEVAKAVMEDTNGDGMNDQFGYLMNISRTLPCIYIQGQWLMANGLRVYDQADDGTLVCNIDSEAGIDFFKWGQELGKYSPNDLISYDNNMIEDAFANGKIAMYTFGTWMLDKESFNTNLAENGVEYELILNPEGLAGSAGASGGWLIGMGANSENKDAAWEVLRFATDPEVCAYICSGLPPMEDAYNYEPFNSEKYDIFKEQLETSQTAAPVFVAEFYSIVDAYGEEFIAAVLGEKTPEEAAATADAGVEKILAEIQQ